MKTVVLTCVSLFTLSGCATVTRGMTDQVQIHSDPDGARATTSMGQSCVTPCTLSVGRKDEFTVHYEKPGYASENVDVKTQIAPSGAAGFAGNIIIGGIIGMGADAVTGATLDHVPNPVNANLSPLNGKPEAGGKRRRAPAGGNS